MDTGAAGGAARRGAGSSVGNATTERGTGRVSISPRVASPSGPRRAGGMPDVQPMAAQLATISTLQDLLRSTTLGDGDLPLRPDATPADVLCTLVSDMVQRSDLDTLREMQKQVYATVHASHTSLAAFNEFSAQQMSALASDLHKRTQMMRDLRSDLDDVFQRIRRVRQHLKQRYPHASRLAEEQHPAPLLVPDDDDLASGDGDDDDDDDDDESAARGDDMDQKDDMSADPSDHDGAASLQQHDKISDSKATERVGQMAGVASAAIRRAKAARGAADTSPADLVVQDVASDPDDEDEDEDES